MADAKPIAGRSFRPVFDGAWKVEVNDPDQAPFHVGGFYDEASALLWILRAERKHVDPGGSMAFPVKLKPWLS